MYIDVGATSDWDVKKKLDIRPGDPILPDSLVPGDGEPEPAARQGVGQPHRLRAGGRGGAARSRARSTPTRCSRSRRCRRKSACAARRPRRSRSSPTSRIALDVGIAHDTPGTEGDEKLGGGPLVVIYDAICDPEPQAARPGDRHGGQKLKMPLQFESGRARRHRRRPDPHDRARACPASSMGIAARYIHSHISIIDRRDFDATVKLLVALVKRLDRKTVDGLC